MNSTRFAIPAVLLFVCMGLLVACGGSPVATPTPLPTPSSTVLATQTVSTPTATPPAKQTPQPTPTDSINITSDDYTEAWDKWQAADIVEYEVIVDYVEVYSELRGEWRLRVREGKIVEIYRGGTKIVIDNGRGIPNPEANPSSLGFMTIESQFARIKEAVDDPSSRHIVVGGTEYEAEYVVEFDGVLGYPRFFGIYPSITDNDQLIRVEAFRVIEQGSSATVVVTPAPAFPTGTPVATPTAATATDTQVEGVIENGNAESQAVYDEMLALWRGSGITEYEIASTLQSEGVDQFWVLHVTGDEVEVVSSSEDPDPPLADAEILLPDKQFELMEQVLAGNDDAGIEIEGQRFHVTYDVEFDAEYGYPTHIEMIVKPGPVYDMGYVISVEEFEVISRE